MPGNFLEFIQASLGAYWSLLSLFEIQDPWYGLGFVFFPVCFGDVGSSALPLPWIAQLKERNRR